MQTKCERDAQTVETTADIRGQSHKVDQTRDCNYTEKRMC